jgi:hypothetical protein
MRTGLSTTEVQRFLSGCLDDKAQSKILGGLGFMERLTLRSQGSVKIGECRLDGWSCALPIYLFRCDKHGYQLSYPNRHYMLLICPVCNLERRSVVDAHPEMEEFVEQHIVA